MTTANNWAAFLTAEHRYPALHIYMGGNVRRTTSPIVSFDRTSRTAVTRSGSVYVLGEHASGVGIEEHDFDMIERALRSET